MALPNRSKNPANRRLGDSSGGHVKSGRPTEFLRLVLDLLAPLGEVRARAMFGGFGVYRRDAVFAIVVDDRLYFKTDHASGPEFSRMGLGPFTYVARGRTITLQYHEAPPEVFDSSAVMGSYALAGLQVAQRAGKSRRRRLP